MLVRTAYIVMMSARVFVAMAWSIFTLACSFSLVHVMKSGTLATTGGRGAKRPSGYASEVKKP